MQRSSSCQVVDPPGISALLYNKILDNLNAQAKNSNVDKKKSISSLNERNGPPEPDPATQPTSGPPTSKLGGLYQRAALKTVYITCPTCGRKFGEKAADRHINWCREKAKIEHIKRQGSALRDAALKKAKMPTPIQSITQFGFNTARATTNHPPARDPASVSPRGRHQRSSPLFKQSAIGKGIHNAHQTPQNKKDDQRASKPNGPHRRTKTARQKTTADDIAQREGLASKIEEIRAVYNEHSMNDAKGTKVKGRNDAEKLQRLSQTQEGPRDELEGDGFELKEEENEVRTVVSDEARLLADKNKLQSSALSNFKEFDPQR